MRSPVFWIFMRTIRRVAVLGAGTMGSRIAAHFANAGVPARLLDLTTAAARTGIEVAIKQNPGAFYTPAAASLITPGSFDDHLGEILDCDWIIEAVTENLAIKRDLWSRVDKVRKPDAILATNTSGIPRSDLRRLLVRFRAPIPWHALLQSSPLSAFGGSYPGAGNRSRPA